MKALRNPESELILLDTMSNAEPKTEEAVFTFTSPRPGVRG